MSHNHSFILIHAVLSKTEASTAIPEHVLEPLCALAGTIAKANGFRSLAVGGSTDHLHMLLSLPSTMQVARALQLITIGTSRFLNEQIGIAFEWQQGFGAFSVGMAQKQSTIDYIRGQAAFHLKQNFAEEYRVFLARHGIVFDYKNPIRDLGGLP
jgi:putative transposase